MSHHDWRCSQCEKCHDRDKECQREDVEKTQRLRDNPKERKYSFWDEIGGHV